MQRKAFTLVELLIVTVIIAMLVGMSVPAAVYVMELVRKTACQNNLKEITTASLSYQTAHSSGKSGGGFPPGGWGGEFIGDPTTGKDRGQSGSFLYSILPNMDQTKLYELPNKATNEGEKEVRSGTLISMPVELFVCPSRRDGFAPPNPSFNLKTATGGVTDPGNIEEGWLWYHSDYAGNGGNNYTEWLTISDPLTADDINAIVESDEYKEAFTNENLVDAKNPDGLGARHRPDRFNTVCNGVIYQFSSISLSDMSNEGSGAIYFMGEKLMDINHYTDGLDNGDLAPAFGSHQNSTVRYALPPGTYSYEDATSGSSTSATTGAALIDDASGLQDLTDMHHERYFGGPHSGSTNMAFCDGTNMAVSNNIDPRVHMALGGRNDGGWIDDENSSTPVSKAHITD